MKEPEPNLKFDRAKESSLETVKEINRKIKEVSVYAIPGLCVRRGDISTPSQLKFILQEVVNVVCETFEIDKKGLLKVMNSKREWKRRKCTTQKYSDGMHVCVFIIHQIAKIPLQRIGDAVGNREHSTILYAIKKVDGQCEMYRDFRGQINTILFRMGYPQLPKQRWKLR